MLKTKILFVFVLAQMVLPLAVKNLYAADDPNRFNRLFTPPDQNTPLLKNDGIHDSENPGLGILQEPKEAFKPLEKDSGGNYVNWVKSLVKGEINPRYDYNNANKKVMPMDLNIAMEVKGSMPSVVFPHKSHTEWLDCANCHPDIFVPKKGANRMSMAEIMLGKKCGVCHGSVAFPVTECRRCHSQTDVKDMKKVSGKKPSK